MITQARIREDLKETAGVDLITAPTPVQMLALDLLGVAYFVPSEAKSQIALSQDMHTVQRLFPGELQLKNRQVQRI